MFEKQLQGWQICAPHLPTSSLQHHILLKGRDVSGGIWLEPPLKSHGACTSKTNNHPVDLSRGGSCPLCTLSEAPTSGF